MPGGSRRPRCGIESGDRSVRTGLQRADELGHVGQALDELTERLDALERGAPSSTRHGGRCSRTSATICARHWPPLRAAVEAVADGVAPEPERYLRAMQRDVEALSALVDDLFLLARIESGHRPAANPRSGRARRRSRRGVAAGRRRRVRFRSCSARPAVPRSSATPLPSGGSSATSSTTPSTTRRSGSTVRIAVDDDSGRPSVRVLDDGPGFPPDFSPHAFERFARADPGRSRARWRRSRAGDRPRPRRARRSRIWIEQPPGGRVAFELPAAG